MATVSTDKLKEVAKRIREMREICDITETDMAKKTEVSLEDYRAYENGELDFPFTFIHKCSLAFGIGITDLELSAAFPQKNSRALLGAL